jgi:hypothetical protein
MASRRIGRAQARGASRRSRDAWIASRIYESNLAIGALNQGILLGEPELSDLGGEPTLIRTRGELLVAVAPVSGFSYLTVGLAVVDVSPTGTPPAVNPFEQPDDWYWWQSVTLADFGGGHRYHRIEIDSKAMRRISSGAAGGATSRKAVIVAFENDPLSAAAIFVMLTVHTLLRSS